MLLNQAMQAHSAGQLDQAGQLYQDLLLRQPEQVDGLHLFGVLQAQQGRHEQAEALIRRALALRPEEAIFHNNLGNVCAERGRHEEAESCYRAALDRDPTRLDAMNNLGVLLSRRGQAADAELLLKGVIRLSPDFADARQNLASHFLRAGRLGEAVQQCMDGLIVAPTNGMLRRVLGMAYTLAGMEAEAIAVYRAWLAAEPDHPVASFHLAACLGEGVPERAPDAYVCRVFDNFAGTFDAKLADLGYRAPQLVAEAVARALGPGRRALDVLDAGCGTGLCGPLLAAHARRLVGVDLSAGMLRRAVARQVYDALLQGELLAYLRSQTAAFDLLVSADTLCYFGALQGFAEAAAAALRPGGWLCFTVEALDARPEGIDEAGRDLTLDHHLHAHGRYSHRRSYVERCLRDAQFSLCEVQSAVLRMEAGEPVSGWLVLARREA